MLFKNKFETMENDIILLNLADQLEDLKKQVLRMSRKDYEVHKLDIDILQNIIRELYNQVLELEEGFNGNQKAKDEVETPIIPLREEKEIIQPEMKTVVEPEAEAKKTEVPEPEISIELEEKAKETVVIAETEVEETKEVEFVIDEEKEIVEMPVHEEVVTKKKEVVPPVEQNKNTESKTSRSTIDLFSTSEPTIFDKLSHDKEPSIADRMRQSRIADLRQAIGINEKFLFINELFNGDMGKYNKALDELNEMKTKEGVVTYFIELKIHNQWKDDNEAFIKFKELLDRKIE